MAEVADSPKKGRGRPPAANYSPADVADLLNVDVTRVLRALANQKLRLEMFPHAFEKGGEWNIPSRDMVKLMGPGLPRLYWVSEFSELVGLSVPYLNELINLGVVKHRMVLGRKRVPATEYWNLPKHRPSCLRKLPPDLAGTEPEGDAEAPAPPSFFSEEVPTP